MGQCQQEGEDDPEPFQEMSQEDDDDRQRDGDEQGAPDGTGQVLPAKALIEQLGLGVCGWSSAVPSAIAPAARATSAGWYVRHLLSP